MEGTCLEMRLFQRLLGQGIVLEEVKGREFYRGAHKGYLP